MTLPNARFITAAALATCMACGGNVSVNDGGAGFDATFDGPRGVDAPPIDGPAESCMACHNGAETNNYSGSGLMNPHPFGVEGYVACTTCHGGNGTPGGNRLDSHVPPPPLIGDDLNQAGDPRAWFNRLTLTGIDLVDPYEGEDGRRHIGLDYLQFVNPGDLRVVSDGRGCGVPGCHLGEHVQWVTRMPFGTATGILGGGMYAAGLENAVPEQRGVWDDTAGDYAFRPQTDPSWRDRGVTGATGTLVQQPEYGQFSPDDLGEPNNFFNNQDFYDADDMDDDVYNAADGVRLTNRLKADTPLAHAFQEAVSITCGDCHLGSAGANNRYGDFRSSGCTACHMEYSPDGRSRSNDPNVNITEPANPDAIAAPERAHIDRHRIRNVATERDGVLERGISDYACVGCHQGSNRTVLQFWGIRLDQNQDVVNDRQYPANPDTFQTTAADDRLYDPGVGNATFNGRVPEQYLLREDYDADGRDDTPEDVHYAAGMGCIDCHGSRDVHNGTPGDPTSGAMVSRMDQAVMIRCESCHGSIDDYAEVQPCETYDGSDEMCGQDTAGNALRHVTVDEEGNYWLVSRLNGDRHYVPQTRDVIQDNNKRNPRTGEFVYTPFGSYAMGRADGEVGSGIGPLQTDLARTRADFSHTDRLDCVSCHSSWTNNCVGCHLSNAYNADPAQFFFSNITGERILLEQDTADFVYQTPVPFYLGVNSRGMITQTAPGTQVFFRYTDQEGQASEIFAFSDRTGNGNNPAANGRDALPALGHDAMMPHSIRGRAGPTDEGPRYCVACHMTQDGLDTFGGAYAQFRTAMENNEFGDLDFGLLQEHIGQNTGNQLGSPFWVHMVAGLGSGLFVFDENGCPLNPLDNFTRPAFCDEAASENFGVVAPAYNLDGLVEPDGTSNVGSAHPGRADTVRDLRAGAQNPAFAGPLGRELVQRLTNPNYETAIILDAWLDADGAAQGNAAALLAP